MDIQCDTAALPGARNVRACFSNVLEAMARSPLGWHDSQAFIPSSELRQLEEWNVTARPYPKDDCLHNLIAANCRNSELPPTDEKITYEELDCRTNQIAHYLRKRGAKPEIRIGVLLERDIRMITVLLGIGKSGAAYVPLTPAYPRERIRRMLANAGVTMVITELKYRDYFGDSETVVCLDDDDEDRKVSRESASGGFTPVDPLSLAYVIYTSGSTGEPKGVQISHRNVVNFLTSMMESPGFSDQDVFLNQTTISFDISVLELFLPFMVGAQSVVISRKVASNPALLRQYIHRHKVTVVQGTPSTWQMLIQDGWPGEPGVRALCGGEALAPELARQICARTDSLWNMYGPTETTVWSSTCRLRSGQPPILIGRPIANAQIYILDRCQQPVPLGVTGEICIGGDGVARGYLGQPDLTSEKFIPDAFGQASGGRIYRTGDLGRYMEDGSIECLGRVDQQVKIRGYRIELGEIEAVIKEHSGVRDAVVIARDQAHTRQLVGYLVMKAGIQSADDLRRFLAGRLPEYMVPSIYVELDNLPLSSNGKVDRKALPASAPAPRVRHVAPGTVVEEILAWIWGDILGVEPVGVTDNFFELGGHSLLATQIVTRLRLAFQQEYSLDLLFDNPSIRALAQAMVAGEAAPGRTEEIASMMKTINEMPDADFNQLQETR